MDKGAVLIAAASGRALAASARRGGFVPLVADYFADEDLIAIAPSHVRMADGLMRGMDGDEVLAAFDKLAAGCAAQGVVWGTGFEDRPELLTRIAQRWTLWGNGAETVTRVKDPLEFAELCRAIGVPHPETSLNPPAKGDDWLVKRRGGAGGAHIEKANGQPPRNDAYFQRHVTGSPVSALFLADGKTAAVLGFSAQWASPTPTQPFRYGGAVQPAPLSRNLASEFNAVVERLTSAVALVGLNSADFMVEEENFWLLEVNPRPGATLEIFEPSGGSLLAHHIAACEGQLAAPPPVAGAAAAAIVYAEEDSPAVAISCWPKWASDRPRAGTSVEAGTPLCTVHATAPSAAEAERLVRERGIEILARVKSATQ